MHECFVFGPDCCVCMHTAVGGAAPVDSRREELRGGERGGEGRLPREGHESAPRQVTVCVCGIWGRDIWGLSVLRSACMSRICLPTPCSHVAAGAAAAAAADRSLL